MIYTIGYQALTPDRLLAICKKLDAVLLDVRERPVSRKPGFGFRQLEALFEPYGDYFTDTYRLMGHSLGGRGNVKPSGIKTLANTFYEPEHSNCVLMCMENHPSDCHRHQDITGPHFPDALHILGNQVFRSGDLADAIAGHRSYESIESYTLEV